MENWTKVLVLSSAFSMKFMNLFLRKLKRNKKLFKEIGKEEKIFSAIVGDKDFINEIVKLAVSYAKEKYIQPISDLTTLLKIKVSRDIDYKEYPPEKEDFIEDNKKREYKLYDFCEKLNYNSPIEEQILNAIKLEGYRMATLREMLKWAKNNWDRKKIVFALGSSRYYYYPEDGGREYYCAPVLVGEYLREEEYDHGELSLVFLSDNEFHPFILGVK